MGLFIIIIIIIIFVSVHLVNNKEDLCSVDIVCMVHVYMTVLLTNTEVTNQIYICHAFFSQYPRMYFTFIRIIWIDENLSSTKSYKNCWI